MALPRAYLQSSTLLASLRDLIHDLGKDTDRTKGVKTEFKVAEMKI